MWSRWWSWWMWGKDQPFLAISWGVQLELLRRLAHYVTAPTDGRTAGRTKTNLTWINQKQTMADRSETHCWIIWTGNGSLADVLQPLKCYLKSTVKQGGGRDIEWLRFSGSMSDKITQIRIWSWSLHSAVSTSAWSCSLSSDTEVGKTHRFTKL